MNHGPWLVVLIMTCALTIAPRSHAQTPEGDRFSLSVGVFLTDRDTDTRLDTALGDGTDVDLEADLGLDPTDNVLRIDGYVRFSERHRLDFSAFDLSRSSSAQIQRDIQWGDELYVVDTVVDSDFDLTIYKAAYTYSFAASDNGYIGASLGLYVADSSVSLAESNLGQAEVGDVTAPLPVVGLRGEKRLSDRWTVRASGEFFFVEFDDIDGSLIDLFVGVELALIDQMSLGLGYNSVALDVDALQSSFQGSLDWQYDGGMVYLKGSF